MDLEALKQATLGAHALPAVPVGDPAIENAYASQFQLTGSNPIIGALGVNTSNQVANDKAALQAKAKQLSDMADPDKYQKVRKADGGFDFFDPSGKKIDINTYANNTGLTRAQIVSGSENPDDMQYVQDYNNLQDFFAALNNKDTATLESYYKTNPQLAGLRNVPGAAQQVLQLFKNKYNYYYGGGDRPSELQFRQAQDQFGGLDPALAAQLQALKGS